ncbi:PREDICTED: uncharacterized protein LOC104598670 isoform X2 [Nelumbo nucifera]|uniref:Protein SICKLE-like n=2 Tax=Nelumbo nucifera TaxID=4432 RepID=A0A822ZX66_NELNU|nr:PREDICTED: uncharacterized protein LOC104598670 isoform X2 [Nelumbo nucifera]DAD47945.1 TPA_asm: hypothetical protein HUJ06_017882 [Nelumbo nucifera]
MEEAEKRRERLKAMRLEAAQSEDSCKVDSSTAQGYLSNPLIEPTATPLAKENSHVVSRFDYYTDPMSAFSGNKRRSNSNQMSQSYTSPSISSGSPMTRPSLSPSGPRSPFMSVSPAHQFQANNSPDHRTNETHMAFHGPDSWRSPMGMTSPFPGYRETPGPRNRSPGMPGYGFPFNSPRGGGFPSPGLGRGGSPSPGSGIGGSYRFGNSPRNRAGWGGNPNVSSGRGCNYHFNSPRNGSGRGRGRGRGSHAYVSARDRPELFYNKSMMDDPWKFLKPVIRRPILSNCQDTPDSLRSWLPKSINMKKARISETSNEFSSQSSLAECLSASFEEAANDATGI